MGQRLFGVVRGAGTQVREVTPAAPIEQGPFGSTILAGIFRSGPTKSNPSPQGHQVVTLDSGVSQYRRIYGGLTQESEVPLNAEHFYDLAAGAGTLYNLRVTDGSEVLAHMPVYNRDVQRSYSALFPNTKVAAQVALYSAQNGGRWGGRRTTAAYVIADMSVAITGASTVDLVLAVDTLLTDQFVGSIIVFPGVDAAGEFVVIANDDAGLFTIQGVWSDAILASVATGEEMGITMQNVHELTSEPEYLAIVIADSGEGATKFTLQAFRDEVSVTNWSDVDLKVGSDAYWLDAVAGDLANYELDFSSGSDLFSGDPDDPLQRPANWAGVAKSDGIDAQNVNIVNLQIDTWQYVGTGDAYLEETQYQGSERPCTIVCTFTSATAFDAVITFEDGAVYTGVNGALGTIVNSVLDFFPSFRLQGLSVAPIAGDKLTINSRPLPPDLVGKGGLLYPAAAPSEGEPGVSYQITANTVDSVTVSTAIDLTGDITVPTNPGRSGTLPETYTLTAAEVFIYDAGDGAGDVTLTTSLSGAFSAAAVIADLNTQADAAYTPQTRLIEFSLSDTGTVRVELIADAGTVASWTIKGATSTINTILGLPTSTDVVSNGVDGTIMRLQYRQEMGGGYDGVANISDADYEEALGTSPTADPLSRLLPLNTGVICIGVPGVSSAAVQTAAMQWAFVHNGFDISEIPDTIISDSAAVAYHKANLAVGSAQDYHACYFPSYGKITNPYGKGLYTTSMVGAIFGYMARAAVDNGGFQVAPAGLGAALSPLFKDLTTGDTVLNNELLNGYGLTEVRKRGAAIYLWGDRIPGNTGRPFIHQRKTVSHIGRVLLTNADSLIFRKIDTFAFVDTKKTVRELFFPWFLAGWFDDSQGQGFSDQVDIKVDDTNNPLSERKAGRMHTDIGFNVVGTAEQSIFSLGAKGVSEG